MMVSKREARANRRKALAGTMEKMTVVTEIRKRFASGRPRKHDQIFSPLTAYGLAGEMLESVQKEMTAKGLDPADVKGVLIVNELGGEAATEERPVAVPLPVSIATMDETLPKLREFFKPIPVGVIFQIADPEDERPGHRLKQWASYFVAGPAAIATMKQAMEKVAAGSLGKFCA
jgi:hypothetical protein